MHHFKMITSGLVMVAMAACSSSSGGGDDPDYTSFAEIQPDAAAMQALYTDANGALLTGVTPAAEMDIPDTGSSTYAGFVTAPLSDGDLIGQLTLTTTFTSGGGSIDSSATGFFHEVNGAYGGTLTGSGLLTQSPPMNVSQVSASLDGDLTNGGNTFDTSIALEGDIVANGADPAGAMAGTADGSVGIDIFLDGVFAAER